MDTVIVNPAVTEAGEGATSAASRPAILAGGVAAAALGLALFAFGAGPGGLAATEGGGLRDGTWKCRR